MPLTVVQSVSMEESLESALPAMALGAARRERLAAEDFDALVRANQQRIYRILLALVRDPDTADTLTQECFLRAFQKRESFRGAASVGTWLVRIAINLARDHGKNRRAGFWRRLLGGEAEAQSSAAPDTRPSSERSLMAREQADAVWRAVARLTERQRTIFILRFVEEMSTEEIAAATGLERGTVKSHLFRAVANVRRGVKEQER